MSQKVRIGTRKSDLAVAQTKLAAELMMASTPGLQVELVMKQTTGDRILDKPLLEFGGKGVFVSEFEEALQKGEIDFAVHSAKDLPSELAEGLEIVGVPERGDIRDVFVTRRDGSLEEKIRKGETIIIGTSSLRRQIQAGQLAAGLWQGAKAECRNLRGNVLTRLEKLAKGEYDAIILAAAGLKRLDLIKGEEELEAVGTTFRFIYLDWREMIPAGCQGILAIEGRKGDPLNEIARKITDPSTLLTFRLERKVLSLMEAGCHEPVGICSVMEDGEIEARGIYQDADGEKRTVNWKGSPEKWEQGAFHLADGLKPSKGADNLKPLKGGDSSQAYHKEDSVLQGSVILVGAGPGDPELITQKGLKALKNCDTVVYDSLASEELLKEVKPDCRKIYVGKRAGRHSMSQEEINTVLIEQAREGRTTVRLKGGDPFVFGRGGEEILALQEAAVPYEVIPGVTSAVAALAAAGIPVTHRGISRSFHVITGHTKEDGIPEDIEHLGNVPGTLIFLMGLNHLGAIRDSLLRQGRPAKTPAAVIQNGTLPQQKVVRGCLGDIEEKCREAGIGSPAIIAVGEAAALHMEATLKRPLEGTAIGVIGTPSFAARLEEALRERGARTERICTMEVVPAGDESMLQKALEELKEYTWLAFTSSNGVRLFLDELMKSGRDLRALGNVRLAAVGSGTAEELKKRGLRADFIPEQYCTGALARGLAKRLTKEDRILIPRAVKGSPELTEILQEAGIPYRDLPIYDVKAREEAENHWAAALGDLDYLTFASSSGVEAFFRKIEETKTELPPDLKLACIGEATERALEKYGKRANAVGTIFTAAGLAEAICKLPG